MRGATFSSHGPVAALGALVMLISTWVGCGHKMAPIAPGAYPPPVVKDLTFERQGDQLTLFWQAPAVRSERESPAVGFRVLRARQSASEAPCPTCRARYQVAGEVRLAGRDASERLQFQDRLEAGYNYRYKVIGYSADGIESKDSVVVHPTD